MGAFQDFMQYLNPFFSDLRVAEREANRLAEQGWIVEDFRSLFDMAGQQFHTFKAYASDKAKRNHLGQNQRASVTRQNHQG
jgi:hypothetical protein